VTRATLAGCGALALWAFLAVLARGAVGIPPLQLTAMGFAVAGVLGVAVVAARGRLSTLRQPALVWAHGVGGLFGYHALYFAALAWAPPVEAGLLNYLWPLLIVLLSAPILGLRLGPARLVGVGLGFAGCALLLASGARFALDVLHGAARRPDLALALASEPGYPSWQYMIENSSLPGTMYEDWTGPEQPDSDAGATQKPATQWRAALCVLRM
jgi:drug/metabolite transporter (DMT)-like permease